MPIDPFGNLSLSHSEVFFAAFCFLQKTSTGKAVLHSNEEQVAVTLSYFGRVEVINGFCLLLASQSSRSKTACSAALELPSMMCTCRVSELPEGCWEESTVFSHGRDLTEPGCSS